MSTRDPLAAQDRAADRLDYQRERARSAAQPPPCPSPAPKTPPSGSQGPPSLDPERRVGRARPVLLVVETQGRRGLVVRRADALERGRWERLTRHEQAREAAEEVPNAAR